ncbi:MAG: alkyl hydroperoxide reductase [Bryobacteraceae bacterium]
MRSLFAGAVLAGLAAAASPTYTQDVARILNDKCVICHRSGDIAPMQFTTYEQVRPWSAAIKEAVLRRKMPPWFADPAHGTFRNDRRLSETQIATLVAWFNAGSPKGDSKHLPPPPAFPDGWSHSRPPDMVVSMPLEVTVQATGQMDLQNYYVKVPFTEDKFVEAVELRPGNRRVVHHSIVNIVTLPDGLEPEQLLTGKKLGRTGWKLIGQAPGKGFETHHHGVAKRLAPGSYFEFNMHYTPTGKGEEKDRSLLGLWFARGPVRHEVLTRAAAEELYRDGKRISRMELPRIPANDPSWGIVGRFNVKDDITLYSVSPHMHFRGKDMKYSVKFPDGREQVLLNVPDYHYEWQLNYEFEKPVKIPAGSAIVVDAHYDNSRNNPRNPAPNEEVIWGQQSWNEMFVPWMEFSVDKAEIRAPKASTTEP